ncbi:hemerythrin domain-containing protein [Pistricoccus aurantiacus]|uniref:hemerythrin domain-containing protein n=1 Tax=Pistricoccus aurantiacus TaxID=1883414 RepID=UPI00363C5F41
MLKQLRLDHANMARLMHVLHLKYKTLAEGERPNFKLMREVVDYILDYMHGFTLPLEKLCSEHLLERAPQAKDVSQRLGEEYHALNERLKQLSDNLDSILMDAVVPMDRFAEDLKAYLDAHRTYLRHEREELFPLIREHFDDEDLQRLAEAMPEDAQAKLAELQEAYPQLYEEFREAEDPTQP